MIRKSGIKGKIEKVFSSNSDNKEDIERELKINNVIEKDNRQKGKSLKNKENCERKGEK